MSAARRPGGGWFTQSYDKLLLAVVLTLLLFSGIFLLIRTDQAKRADGGSVADLSGTGKRSAAPVDLAPITNLMVSVVQPLQVSSQSRRLMVGELRVASITNGAPIAYDAKIDPFFNVPQPAIDDDPDSDGDGLTDKQELLAGLDPMDASDATSDLDGDGYSNSEELSAGTSLKDKEDYPPPVAKLRLVRTVVNPFKFRFLGVSKLPDGDRFQLNLRSLERTYFARLGDTIEGYKVESYEEKTPDGPVLSLQKGTTTIRLVQGRVINQEARMADLILLLDGSRYRRQIGDELKLKDLLYKVVDIKADRVVLRDERDGKESTVSVLSLEERNRLQSENAAPAAPASPESPAVDAAAVTEALFK